MSWLARCLLSICFLSLTALPCFSWTEAPPGSGNWTAEPAETDPLSASGGETVTVGEGVSVETHDPAITLETEGYTVTVDGEVVAQHITDFFSPDSGDMQAIVFTESGSLINSGLVESIAGATGETSSVAVDGTGNIIIVNSGIISALSENTTFVDPLAAAVLVDGELDLDNTGLLTAAATGEGPTIGFGAAASQGGSLNSSGEVAVTSVSDAADAVAGGLGVANGDINNSGIIIVQANGPMGALSEGIVSIGESSIDNSGEVFSEAVSSGGPAQAVGIGSQDGAVVNSGTVAADADAATPGQATASGVVLDNASLNNSGAIIATAENSSGETTGVLLVSNAIVENTGTIEGQDYAIYAPGSGSQFVSNEGTLAGDVSLGGGFDVFRLGEGFTVIGIVDGGSEEDTLVLNDSGTLDIDIVNFENLNMFDAGVWYLDRDLTLTNLAFIEDGELVVRETLAAPEIVIAEQGTISGNGVLEGAVQNFGTLNPGESFGALTIDGEYISESGSNLVIELNAAGDNDKVFVTGAPGTATINGGDMQVLAEKNLYKNGQTWDVVITDNGVTGEYDSVQTPGSLILDFGPVYQPDIVQLQVNRNSYADFAKPCDSRQVAAGEYLDAVVNDGADLLEGDLRNVFIALDWTDSAADIESALAALHPEPYAGYGELALQTGRIFRSGAHNRMRDLRFASPNRATGLYARLMGAQGGQDDECDVTGYDYTTTAAMLGVDHRVRRNVVVGGYLGYGVSDMDMDGGVASADDSDHWTLGAYATYYGEKWFAEAVAGYTRHEFEMHRDIQFLEYDRTASGDFDGDEFAASLAGGCSFTLGSLLYGPEVSLEYANLSLDSFDEDGAGDLGLEVDSRDIESLRSGLGVWAALPRMFDTWRLVPNAKLMWKHEFLNDDDEIKAALIGDPTDNKMTIDVEDPETDVLEASIGATAYIDAFMLSLDYVGEYFRDEPFHSVEFGLGYSF